VQCEKGRSFGHNLTGVREADEERSVMDVAHADTVEADLDRLVSRRASQDRRSDPDEQEELWKASVRRYNARRREENRRAWCEYFSRLAGSLRARAAECARWSALLTNAEERTS
jgi:hypothetical protein